MTANTVITANVSPIIPFQFPGFYQDQYPNFVGFVEAYFQWLEQANNAQYYARRIYDIKDVDNTLDQFIIYFKEKYLQNIHFNTTAPIRTVIKHALDIYRSKGTERGTTLLFQLAFDKIPSFYYPSVDLMRTDDGQWVFPYYVELTLQPNNILFNQKEVQGAFSQAKAFVDTIVRRKTNNRLEDVAYISAITGSFFPGEKLVPVDGSIPIANCPFIVGSLNTISLLPIGSGSNYNLNDIVPVVSFNGQSAKGRIAASSNAQGAVQLQFIDGGYGYQVNAVQATINISNVTGSFTNNSDVFTYLGSGALMGQGTVLTANSTVLVVDVLTGNLNNSIGQIYSAANTNHANIASYVGNTYGPNVYISNSTLTISNMTMNTSNLEVYEYFTWFETITEPMANITYVSANGSLPVGANIYVYFVNNALAGQGTIIEAVTGGSNTGTLVVSILSGNLHFTNAFFTVGNTVTANAATYQDISATGTFIANSVAITLNVNNVNGIFIDSEEIFQTLPLSGPVVDEKIGGWGFLTQINLGQGQLSCNLIQGRFISGPIKGLSSGATANVASVNLNLGLVNLSTNPFIASPYSYVKSTYCSGNLTSYNLSGTNFSVNVIPTIIYPETISTNIDKISSFGNVIISAATIGFPANPSGNSTNATIAALFTNGQFTIGKLNNIVLSGSGAQFKEVPYLVVDDAYVSNNSLFDDFVQYANATSSFAVGELVTQIATNARGIVKSSSNNVILSLQRLSFTNNFVATTNSTTQIKGLNSGAVANVIGVDYDIFSPVMGRNVSTDVLFTTGNNVPTQVLVVDSGFGFVNGEQVTIGSNGAVGTAILGGQGTGSGFYLTRGGFDDDVKKLYDGWFYQNFSYQIIAPLMLQKYEQMVQDITHVAGTKLFGRFVHTYVSNTNMSFAQTAINIH